ncbi:hypothetical protein MD484_g1208, partial [Candolleomyces efflorescens]
MSSSSSTPAHEHDSSLLHIGKQCADPLCRLVDFLPFKCPHCTKSFCQDHYKVEAHSCPDYDESKHNRVAPDFAVRPGQDPNVRLEIHFEKECSVLTGKLQSKSTPLCARGNCRKVLFSPIKCDQQSSSAAMPFRPALPSFASASDTAKNINAKASGAVASVKKTVASAAAASSSSSAAKSGGPDVFRKTDRALVNAAAAAISRSVSASASDTTPSTTKPTTTVSKLDNEPEIRPASIINAESFIPRPIFANA